MKHRIISDLHIDPEWTRPFILPITEDEKNTVLVIAGDAGEGTKACGHIAKWSDRFHSVIYVMGNHEYYNRSMVTCVSLIRKEIKGLTSNLNIHVLDQQSVEIDGVLYLGCTLWTDFDRGNCIVMYEAETFMNDYRRIRRGTIKEPYRFRISADYIGGVHLNHLEWLRCQLKDNKDRQVVVITHHAPCELSVADRYSGDGLNGCYYSDLSELILESTNIVLWVHGHMHNRSDYVLGSTRVLCNARGYDTTERKEDTGFDPELIIELQKVISNNKGLEDKGVV